MLNRLCTKIFLIAVTLFSLLGSIRLYAQSGLEFILTPAVEIPLGPKDDIGDQLYTIGFSGSFAGEYSLLKGYFTLLGHLDYNLLPTVAETSLSVISLGAGVGTTIPIAPWFDIKFAAGGGYGLGIYDGEVGGSLFVKGTGQFRFNLSPSFSLGLGGGYRLQDSLYSSAFAGLTATLALSRTRKMKVEIYDIRFNPVFPVFYSYYTENPVGSVKLINKESGPIKNVTVSFFVQGYMDKPKISDKIPEMKKGEEKEISLYALFNKSILGITEGTKVNAEIKVSYEVSDNTLAGEENETLQIYDRNAMTWDDDRKAACFVTAKDPTVLAFGKRYGGLVRDEGSSTVSRHLRIGMGIFQALTLTDLNYVIDPTTPYEEFSKNSLAVDYLQFPVQTLEYKAGDCDDLSILFCSLMESVGIESAFITIPGHIFTAFSLELSPEEAKKTFRDAGSFIIQNEKAWIPVEVTALQGDFLSAWNTGASLWNKHDPNGESELIPVHEAWRKFDPVGFESEKSTADFPSKEEVLASFHDVMGRFIQIQIGDRIGEILQEIEKTGGEGRSYNKLGVLYARFGQYDRAEEAFENALAKQYTRAEVNLGHVLLMLEKYDEAAAAYNNFLKRNPGNAKALAGLTRAFYEQNDIAGAKEAFAKLREVDRGMAERYAYMVGGQGGTDRASDADALFMPVWEEE